MPPLTHAPSPASASLAEPEVLDAVQRRVLWLATSMVHHANKVRASDSGIKVGGHQASSASSSGCCCTRSPSSGARTERLQDLYRCFGIDTETIIGAALDLLG